MTPLTVTAMAMTGNSNLKKTGNKYSDHRMTVLLPRPSPLKYFSTSTKFVRYSKRQQKIDSVCNNIFCKYNKHKQNDKTR